MAVKIYRAKDLCEAFALIRNDFGLNATILETREIQSRKFFGLIRGENLVEVTATDEEFDGARVSVSEKSIRSENHEPFRKQGGMGTGELPESETEENADAVSGEVSENRKKNIFRAAEMRFMEEGDLGRLSEGNEEQRRENASLTDFSEPRDISFRESPPRDGTFCASSEVENVHSASFRAANEEKMFPVCPGGIFSFADKVSDSGMETSAENTLSSVKTESRKSILQARTFDQRAFSESSPAPFWNRISGELVSECAEPECFSGIAEISEEPLIRVSESTPEIERKNESAVPAFRKRRSAPSQKQYSENCSESFSERLLPSMESNLLFGNGNSFFSRVAGFSEEKKLPIPARFRDALLQIYSKLQTADMDEYSIADLMARLREDELLYAAAGKREPNANLRFLEKRLQELVCQEIQTAGPIPIHPGKRQTVALVGPTGVGKTTTIAKLAIDYRQKKNCQVGLITFDLSRMGAVEQLQTFADVIGIPMLCASTKRQLRDAIARMNDFDLVLIDTAGQSRAGELSLQEMRLFFDTAQVNSVMLVLSVTARLRLLTQTVESFKSLGTTSLVLTKLDESLGLGNLFPLLRTAGLPVSYLTTGQKVPDDFETADRARLAKLILGDEQIR